MTSLRLHHITTRQNRNLFERLVTSMRERAVLAAARESLKQMDDHMLRDVGVNRSALMSDLF